MMTFEELTQRVHDVMDAYEIPHDHDLAFLRATAGVFGITLRFKVEPIAPEPVQDLHELPDVGALPVEN